MLNVSARKTNAVFSFLLISALLFPSVILASQLKPFILASIEQSDLVSVVTATQVKLEAAGFNVIGKHHPYDEAVILVITNDELLKNAAASDFGGYGAIQRVAVTQVEDNIQVSYTNPVYMSYAYQMAGHLENIEEILKETLGFIKPFGSKAGFTSEELEKYHYMFGMPYFGNPITLNKFVTYEKAIDKVKRSLADKKGGAYQVFFQEIPGKKQAIFGVGLTKALSSDKQIMEQIDFKALKSTAHLPYEMLVNEDGAVYILSPKFRIAINFSDLEMVGEGSFVGIMNSPVAIRDALIEASGGEVFNAQDNN